MTVAGRVITLHDGVPAASDGFVTGLAATIRDSCGYVMTGPYLATLFGREGGCREAEFLLPHLSPSLFLDVMAGIRAAGYTIMTPGEERDLFRMVGGQGIRIAPGDGFFPNALVRCIHHDAEEYAYLHRRHLRFGPHRLFITPPEILIPSILMPGAHCGTSGDAVYLHTLLEDQLCRRDLRTWIRHLGVTAEASAAGIEAPP
ncbi:hypothetical protein AZH53_08045 [Methanomicrobiaceae archaeon CYW5]|uniref:hypothetical protein n=1 Tax=Methanovulcanius yangii TaxID=1789227 RepID=UPI0029CA8E90|nr:hypothetical protein [Methanovulcanius yangii]MBT8508354.1 hypothetical protein [Methanovulcanius yangii]